MIARLALLVALGALIVVAGRWAADLMFAAAEAACGPDPCPMLEAQREIALCVILIAAIGVPTLIYRRSRSRNRELADLSRSDR